MNRMERRRLMKAKPRMRERLPRMLARSLKKMLDVPNREWLRLEVA